MFVLLFTSYVKTATMRHVVKRTQLVAPRVLPLEVQASRGAVGGGVGVIWFENLFVNEGVTCCRS